MSKARHPDEFEAFKKSSAFSVSRPPLSWPHLAGNESIASNKQSGGEAV